MEMDDEFHTYPMTHVFDIAWNHFYYEVTTDDSYGDRLNLSFIDARRPIVNQKHCLVISDTKHPEVYYRLLTCLLYHWQAKDFNEVIYEHRSNLNTIRLYTDTPLPTNLRISMEL